MNKILTIGYEAADPDDFIATLKLANVDVLLDVRELPISRRKGFAKTALGNMLESNGIKYQHEKLLGSPKVIRHQLREDKDLDRFFKDFNIYIDTQKELLTKVASEIDGNVALMCYERDHKICHRSVVAEKLGYITDTKPKHIGVQKGVASQLSKNQSLDFGKSLPTA